MGGLPFILTPNVQVRISVNIHQTVLPAAQADLLGVFQGVQAVSGLDPAHQRTEVLRGREKRPAGYADHR